MNTEETLRELPRLEQQMAVYEQMVEQVEQRLEQSFGLQGWSTAEPASYSLCGNGEVKGARYGTLPTRLLPGGVDDDTWEAAVDDVVAVVGTYGFTVVERVIDQPGEHEVVVHGEREALVRFGTIANATLDVLTGCHLVEQPD